MDENGGMADLLEIDEPRSLCLPSGRLDRTAVGWSRRPLHTANLRGRGRSKRWEYWAILAPTHVLAVTVSDLDYAALHAVYFLGPDGSEVTLSTLVPLGRVRLPATCGGGPVAVREKDLSIDILPDESGVRLLVESPRISADVRVERPPGHESLGVVVPWSDRLFQYTVKDNTLPVEGTTIVDGHSHAFAAGSWATLDHGRGRWPYRISWNWGSGSGRTDGEVVGIQVGGRWTNGTGSTENALCLDGRIHVIGEELAWEYDRNNWMRPWRIWTPASDRVDLHFTPLHMRADRTSLGILFNDTHQAFGDWSGTMSTDDGRQVRVDGIRGWAEEVVNRW
jgi:hypothetical protein